jgi:hypothetical protein
MHDNGGGGWGEEILGVASSNMCTPTSRCAIPRPNMKSKFEHICMFVEGLKFEIPDTVTKFMSHKEGEEDLKTQINWLLAQLLPLLICYIPNRKLLVHLDISLITIQCCVRVFGFTYHHSMLCAGIWFHLSLFNVVCGYLVSLITIQCCVWVFGFTYHYSMLCAGIWFHLSLFNVVCGYLISLHNK